jgi:hypothetical protein
MRLLFLLFIIPSVTLANACIKDFSEDDIFSEAIVGQGISYPFRQSIDPPDGKFITPPSTFFDIDDAEYIKFSLDTIGKFGAYADGVERKVIFSNDIGKVVSYVFLEKKDEHMVRNMEVRFSFRNVDTCWKYEGIAFIYP